MIEEAEECRRVEVKMTALRRGMIGFVGLVFLLLSYNLLTNRPLRTRTESARVQAAKALQTKLWGSPSQALGPCWNEPPRRNTRKDWGYVLVNCSHGPHHHRTQIANAVVVAQHLGATLIMPTIKEGLKESGSNFDDIYNVKHFIATLEGVVRIMGRLPEELRTANRTSIEVPRIVSKTYIEQTIRPIFEKNMIIVLDKFLPNLKETKEDRDAEVEAVHCMVKHEALLFIPQIEKIGNRLKNRITEAAQLMGGRYIAVDYRSEILSHKPCDQGGDSLLSKKRCLSPHALGMLLKAYGFPPETAIYLTQSHLDESFDPLLSIFPNVITKEYSLPFNEENQFLYTGKTQFELALDFYVCSHSDVFVPVVPGTFFYAVAGERIKFGLAQVLVPTLRRFKTPAHTWSPEPVLTLGVSQIVTQKVHPVLSCFCETRRNKRPEAKEPSTQKLDEEQ